MIKLVDTFSYTNRLRAVSPIWKCSFAAVLFVISYVSHPIVQAAVFCWLSVWIVVYARLPLAFYLKLISLSCGFYAASLPALIVEIQTGGLLNGGQEGNILFHAAHWTVFVTQNGLHHAGILFMRIASCLSCMAFIMLTTSLAELFQVLKKLRMPALVLELMLIMYRFIFLLTDTAHDMYTAQLARGGHAGFRNKLHDTAVLVVRLFSKTMYRYKGLSYGLTARGFTDELRMAPYEAKPMPLRYRSESIGGAGIILLLECWIRWRGLQ